MMLSFERALITSQYLDSWTESLPDGRIINMMRIGKFLGWYIDIRNIRYGDWLTIGDLPLSQESVFDGIGILVEQAINTLKTIPL